MTTLRFDIDNEEGTLASKATLGVAVETARTVSRLTASRLDVWLRVDGAAIRVIGTFDSGKDMPVAD